MNKEELLNYIHTEIYSQDFSKEDTENYKRAIDTISNLFETNIQYKTILKDINTTLSNAYINTGFNDDYYEYVLSESEIERMHEMIPEFEEESN